MDVDFDLKSSFNVEDYFDVTLASMVKKGKLVKHNVGTYFQRIPIDPMTNLSAIPYKEAERLGYLKIDFLTMNLLDVFSNNDQIRVLADTEPDWDMLLDEEVVQQLFHIHKHYKLINKVKPRSIEELGDCLALRIPTKRYLLDSYVLNKTNVRKVLYTESDGFNFKKSHAIAYATTIVVQMHLVKYGVYDVIK